MTTADSEALCRKRDNLTSAIAATPYDPHIYCERSLCYLDLKYPDLAVGDAYKAVLLADYVRQYSDEEELELAEGNKEIEQKNESEQQGAALATIGSNAEEHEDTEQSEDEEEEIEELYWARQTLFFIRQRATDSMDKDSVSAVLSHLEATALHTLIVALFSAGCTSEAREYCTQAVRRFPASDSFPHDFAALLGTLSSASHGRSRRVVYPWNAHEPDRFSPDTIAYINSHLVSNTSDACEAAVVDLPFLSPETGAPTGETIRHLGVFATRDIGVGEIFLRERGTLTVVTEPMDGGLCEHCGGRWRPEILPSRPTLQVSDTGRVVESPRASRPTSPTPEEHPETFSCELCDAAEAEGEPDVIPPVWCSAACRDAALTAYHPALCCRPVGFLHRAAHDVAAPAVLGTTRTSQPGGEVYALLLMKTFAMALTQGIHPLELDETKYLYGVPAVEADIKIGWGFEENVRGPVAVLEALGVDAFGGRAFAGGLKGKDVAVPSWWDTWVVNTLIAKFRGVASGRLDSLGRTESAACHTVYSMINHSCEPNVRWQCQGVMKFWGTKGFGYDVPKEEDQGKDVEREVAVTKGQEVLSCYCDPELPVKERREWMMGCLGGVCLCERCVKEAAVEVTTGKPAVWTS